MDNSPLPQASSVNIRTAAEELGLSVSTVSRALSGKGRVSEATRARVVEWTRQNAWLPSSVSRALLYGHTRNIAVLLPKEPNDEMTPFFHYCVLGACEAAEVLNYDVIVLNSPENDSAKLAQVLRNSKVDGVIITSRVSQAFYDLLREADVPFVLLGTVEDESIIQIDHDVKNSSYQLTALLLDEGTGKIAFLGGNGTHPVNRHREQGFYSAVCAARGNCDRSLIFTGLDNPVKLEQTVLKIIERQVRSIVVSDDVLCSIIIARLNWLGVSIPQEMRVASCYHSFLMDIQAPQVTCVKSNPKKLSSEATQALIRLIAGEEVPHRKLVEYEILVRGSTMQERGSYKNTKGVEAGP